MIIGEYFEAGISNPKPATIEARDDQLVLASVGLSLVFDLSELGVSKRLAGVPRRVHFPDGSMFSTNHNEQVDELLCNLGRPPAGSWISFFEHGWRWTLLALFAIPMFLYLLFTVGMPIVAGPIASMVPENIKDKLDVEVVSFLDENVFEPTNLEIDLLKFFIKSIDKVFRDFIWLEDNIFLKKIEPKQY